MVPLESAASKNSRGTNQNVKTEQTHSKDTNGPIHGRAPAARLI